jgi:hypothetical protein
MTKNLPWRFSHDAKGYLNDVQLRHLEQRMDEKDFDFMQEIIKTPNTYYGLYDAFGVGNIIDGRAESKNPWVNLLLANVDRLESGTEDVAKIIILIGRAYSPRTLFPQLLAHLIKFIDRYMNGRVAPQTACTLDWENDKASLLPSSSPQEKMPPHVLLSAYVEALSSIGPKFMLALPQWMRILAIPCHKETSLHQVKAAVCHNIRCGFSWSLQFRAWQPAHLMPTPVQIHNVLCTMKRICPLQWRELQGIILNRWPNDATKKRLVALGSIMCSVLDTRAKCIDKLEIYTPIHAAWTINMGRYNSIEDRNLERHKAKTCACYCTCIDCYHMICEHG